MREFLLRTDLWLGVAIGLVTGVLLGLVPFVRLSYKNKALKELTKIMGQAIEHRSIGERRGFIDENEWVQQAKALEKVAVAKARKVSPGAGSLVEWLDRVPAWNANNDVEKYMAVLSLVIERIHGIIEGNS